MRIVHLSDIHFGRIAYPEIVDVLLGEVNGMAADLVVISGDLTQRARPWQFRRAVAMIRALEAPALVLPGNHDIHAWWHRPELRLSDPLRRYKQFVSMQTSPSYERNGLSVLGVNTVHGWTIKGGRCPDGMRARIRDYFGEQPSNAFRILVAHHPLAGAGVAGALDIARGSRRVLEAAACAGVDLVLCGHWHLSHVEAASEGRVVIAFAGTATSDRWRAPQEGANHFNVVEVCAERFSVEERRYSPQKRAFAVTRRHSFERRRPT